MDQVAFGIALPSHSRPGSQPRRRSGSANHNSLITDFRVNCFIQEPGFSPKESASCDSVTCSDRQCNLKSEI